MSGRLPQTTRATFKERGRLAHLCKITSTSELIDDELEAGEKENPELKNVLNKNDTHLQIDPANFAGLINSIATIPFQHGNMKGAQASRLFLPQQTAKMAVPLFGQDQWAWGTQ